MLHNHQGWTTPSRWITPNVTWHFIYPEPQHFPWHGHAREGDLLVIITIRACQCIRMFLASFEPMTPDSMPLFRSEDLNHYPNLLETSMFLWASFITFGIKAIDSRVSLLQRDHDAIFTIMFSLQSLRTKKRKLIWDETLEKPRSEFQILSRYGFGYMIWGS